MGALLAGLLKGRPRRLSEVIAVMVVCYLLFYGPGLRLFWNVRLPRTVAGSLILCYDPLHRLASPRGRRACWRTAICPSGLTARGGPPAWNLIRTHHRSLEKSAEVMQILHRVTGDTGAVKPWCAVARGMKQGRD